MSPIEQVEELCREIIERETEQLSGIHDKNSCGAGMCMGAIDAAQRVLAFIEEAQP